MLRDSYFSSSQQPLIAWPSSSKGGASGISHVGVSALLSSGIVSSGQHIVVIPCWVQLPLHVSLAADI